MSIDLLFGSYDHQGHREAMVATTPKDSKEHILFIPPLFAEMNKMRSTMIESMRQLADRGIASTLPDLAGCNESLQNLRQQNLNSWRMALEHIVDQHNITHVAAFRGGCLIDNIAIDKPHFRLNSVKGANIIKTMMRSKLIALKESGLDETLDGLSQIAVHDGIELAGYELSAALYNDLQNAVPMTIEGTSENKVGQQVDGISLWIRSEPEYSALMAQSLADTLSLWCKETSTQL